LAYVGVLCDYVSIVSVAVISVGVEEERELQTFDSVRNVRITYHMFSSNIAQ